MRLDPKTLISTGTLLVCALGAGIFLRASSGGDTSSVARVASSAPAPQPDPVRIVQILEEQLTYVEAEVNRAESQRASSQELVRDITERLRIARTESSELVRELEKQLAYRTAEVARLERRLTITQQLVRDFAERLRIARATAGL
jgi:chromosome segregation ATPase